MRAEREKLGLPAPPKLKPNRALSMLDLGPKDLEILTRWCDWARA